jgi:hypothetical protein
VLSEIGSKWSKVSQQRLPALKGNDDHGTDVASQHGFGKAHTERDGDTLLKGCHNLTLTANGRAEAMAMEGDKSDCIDFR